jgi:hypothetical protein
MADTLNQFFGDVPRGADVVKSFYVTGANTTGSTSGWTQLFTVVNQGTTAAAFSTTAITFAGTSISVAIGSTATTGLANEFTFGLVKTNATAREPLAAGHGTAFDVPGL